MRKLSVLLLFAICLISCNAFGYGTTPRKPEPTSEEGENNYCCGSNDKNCGTNEEECACHGPKLGDAYWSQVTGDPFKLTGMVRVYYVTAEEVYWDYAPQGFNVVSGQPFTPAEEIYTKRDIGRIGSKYLKCIYREYTSSSFRTPRKLPEHEEHLGFVGPTFYGEVGDIIKIVFLNKCNFPVSVHPHGVFYFKDSEGAPYEDGTSGFDKNDDAVPTGTMHTYVWRVPERAGPGPHDGSSVMWMYHSHTHEVFDFYAGLIGNMVITRKGMLGNRKPKDVDREVFFMYAIMDENDSPYIEDNIKKFALPPYDLEQLKNNAGFRASNQMFSINGYIYGNAPLLTFKKGERIRYYLMSMGGGRDVHTPFWHGNTLSIAGRRNNVGGMLAAEMMTADMVADAVGVWTHQCHVMEHFANGMLNQYKVVG